MEKPTDTLKRADARWAKIPEMELSIDTVLGILYRADLPLRYFRPQLTEWLLEESGPVFVKIEMRRRGATPDE